MKRLCRDPNPEICEQLRRTLAEHDIECEVREREQMSLFSATEQGNQEGSFAELWIADDTSFARAWSLVTASRADDDVAAQTDEDSENC